MCPVSPPLHREKVIIRAKTFASDAAKCFIFTSFLNPPPPHTHTHTHTGPQDLHPGSAWGWAVGAQIPESGFTLDAV